MYHTMKKRGVGKLLKIRYKDTADKARHDKLVSLVERMLELHKHSAVVRSPLDKERVGINHS